MTLPTYKLVFSLPGIIASVVLFVLFYRNRKQDRLTRRRFLLPFILVLAHSLLFLVLMVFLGDYIFPGYLWFILSLLLLITVMIYWGHFAKWKNFELRAAIIVFTLYCILFVALLLIAFSGIG